MAKLLKLRRGTTSQHSSFTGAEGEVTVDTDKESLVVHNGSTAGGFPIARADGTGVTNFTISGELDAATLDISGNADIDGTLEADAITVNGTALDTHIAGVTVTAATTATNITVSANNSTDETVYPIFVDGATGGQGAESDTGLTYNPSTGVLTTTQVTGNLTGTVTGTATGLAGTPNVTVGDVVAASLDISGNADIDGTMEADAYTVNGTALDTHIAGVTVTTATNAAHVSVADNESTNENNLVPFIEDASATGNVGLESDGDFHYNPSTGTVTATAFAGNVTGNVTGNTSGTAATVTTAAQTNITSLGTLTGLTVAGGEGASGVIGLYADEGDDNADKFQWLVDTSGVMKWQAYSGGSWQDELTLSNAGDLVATGNVTAYSDARLKTDVDTIENALDKVTKLRGVSYTKVDTDQRGIGVIAQEIEEVLPEVVQDGAYKSVAYGNIVGVLIEAIKELKAELDEHKKASCGGE